jgi:DNA-binding response OmpR family regulator
LPVVNRKKILIVEDDADIRIMMEFILRDDYELIFSEDGRCGISKSLEERPDLILLDIYMPGISGIIILTAGALKEEVAEGYALGANDYIFKPFEPEDLIERIEKLL